MTQRTWGSAPRAAVSQARTLRHLCRVFGLAGVLSLSLHAPAIARTPFTASESGHFHSAGACVSGVHIVIAGVGRATHLGNYTYQATECVDLVTGEISNGVFTMTAANGDTLEGTYSGHGGPTANPTIFAFDDAAVIRGGSGRFARTTGRFDSTGTADLQTGTYERRLSGTIFG